MEDIGRESVFISFSAKDRDFVKQRLVPLLRRNNISPWFSDSDIPSAAEWEKKIRLGLESTNRFLVVISPSSIESDWVQTEVHWALEHRANRIIPLLIGECDPSSLNLQLIRYQHIDARHDWVEASAQVLSVWGIEREDRILIEMIIFITDVSGSTPPREETIRFEDFATIGRTRDCDIYLNDVMLSRQHAVVRARSRGQEVQLYLFDMSTNGTAVNGKHLKRNLGVGAFAEWNSAVG